MSPSVTYLLLSFFSSGAEALSPPWNECHGVHQSYSQPQNQSGTRLCPEGADQRAGKWLSSLSMWWFSALQHGVSLIISSFFVLFHWFLIRLILLLRLSPRQHMNASSAGWFTASIKPWTGPSVRGRLSLESWTLQALRSSRLFFLFFFLLLSNCCLFV